MQRLRRKLRHFLPLLIAVITLLSLATPVFAIDESDDISVNAVWVYRNCQETGDHLYIVDYTVEYAANPDENITEAYLVRLLSGATELAAVAPYAYYNDGYDRGVAAIYFTAADAPAWNGAYTMELTGNPTLTWVPSNPSSSVAAFDLWQDNPIATTQDLVASRILWLADWLELTWSVDMIETTASGSVLTEYGESYFVNVIPNIRTVAPSAFSGRVVQPEIERDEFTEDYSDSLVTDIIGTPFDLTDLGTAFGLSREVVTAILYYGVVGIFVVLAVRKIGSYKPVMMFGIPVVIGGAFLGVPLVITILFGFASLGMIGFALFYKPSNA